MKQDEGKKACQAVYERLLAGTLPGDDATLLKFEVRTTATHATACAALRFTPGTRHRAGPR
jgi:hypothetical protein